MLTIRREQLKEFERRGLARFERRMAEHARSIWPERCRRLGEAETRRRVHESVVRARSHGMRREFDVGRFVDLAFVFGEDFDTSDDTSWAARILEDRTHSPRDRMDLLWARAKLEGRLARPARKSAARQDRRHAAT